MTQLFGGTADGAALRYSWEDLRGDYVRAAVGLALTWLPLVLVSAHPFVFWVLLLCGAVFALFLARTVQRQFMTVELTPTGIRARGTLGPNVDIPWAELSTLKLSFYAAKRRRRFPGRAEEGPVAGWLSLTLRGRARTLRVDSTLTDFDRIVARAVEAAAARELSLGMATIANLEEMGVDVRPFVMAEGG